MFKMVLCLQKYGLNKFMHRKLEGKVSWKYLCRPVIYKERRKLKNECLMRNHRSDKLNINI